MSDYLEGYSPFQTGLGRHASMIRIPLGEDRGWIELHTDGRAELFTENYPDGPIFQFNAEDAEILIATGQELATMAEAWQERGAQLTEEQAEAEPCAANPAARTSNKAPELPQPGPKASSNERRIQVEMPAAIIGNNGNGHRQHALKLAGD